MTLYKRVIAENATPAVVGGHKLVLEYRARAVATMAIMVPNTSLETL